MRSPLTAPVSILLKSIEYRPGMRDEEFSRLAHECTSTRPSAVLLSGGELRPSDENRYSILGCDPLLTLTGKGNACSIQFDGQVIELHSDPLAILDRLCSNLVPSFPLKSPPFSGGAIGYLAYELKNAIERLPNLALDDIGLPDLFLFWPGRIMIHDRKERVLCRLALKAEGERPRPDVQQIPAAITTPARFRMGPISSNFTREEYYGAVARILDYITAGDVYQVNLSQRFHFDFEGDSFQLWKSLFDINPAPFYAYINAGDHQVLSTSMERFLFRRNSYIETRPIKGTRGRGRTAQEDRDLISDLLKNPKDDAELSMIVDLLRNDLGRICVPRSIRVAGHKRLETYRNVHHLVSMVTGELKPGISYGNIIRAVFPGGSITGCPKIRAMEIIDELEPNVRHVYTGAAGYIGWHENLDLNVAIRTAIIKDETCYFSVGGGIVYDSREEDEYRETLDKGRTLFDFIKRAGGTPCR